LESYRELQNTANVHAVERKKMPTTSPSMALVTFPESYPFSLIAQWPRAPKGFNGVYQVEGQALFSPAQGETAIVLLVIILSSPKKYLINFFEQVFEIEGRDNFTSLLLQLFRVVTSILDNDAWPVNWLNVNIMANKVLVKMMDAVAALLEKRFIPGDDATVQFNTELWREAFQVLLKLLSSDQLVIEEFSPQVIPIIYYLYLLMLTILPSGVGQCGEWREIFGEKELPYFNNCGTLLAGPKMCLIEPGLSQDTG
jgi:dedicator of cytokinesis protein 3